jgi:hypothetical protein
MDGSELTWVSFDFSNEREFEEVILRKNILVNYNVYDAKKTLNIFRKYRRYADVLLIEKKLKYWCIGEIEISKHSFSGHIFPQLIEIYSLMQENIDLIRKNYLEISNLNKTKEIEDLIRFNKPFLTLIIDKIPTNYSNIVPLLTSFCNINTVIRMKDTNENYSYVSSDFYNNHISSNSSDCFISDILLIIDNPNLIGLNESKFEHLSFKGDKIHFQQHFNRIDGEERLYWILESSLGDGKYTLTNKENLLVLNK